MAAEVQTRVDDLVRAAGGDADEDVDESPGVRVLPGEGELPPQRRTRA